MEIQPNRPLPNVQKANLSRKSASVKSALSRSEETSGSEGVSFFAELVDRLSQMPEMREEILAEARNLLHDPDYPSEDELKKLEFAIAQRKKSD